MKGQILQAINNLDSFLADAEVILGHPYSTGLNVEKIIKDLKDYSKELRGMVEALEEASAPETENVEAAENTSVEEENA